MVKKLLTAAVASAFALTLYAAPTAACPGSDKSSVAKKEDKKTEETKKAEKKSDRKQKQKPKDKPAEKKAT